MKNENIRSFVWKELINSKFQEMYFVYYLDRQRFYKRSFKIATIVVSFSGVLSWKWCEDYAWVAILVSCLMQLLSQTEDLLFRSSDELHSIKNIIFHYRKYLSKYEVLWLDLQKENPMLDTDKCIKKYIKIKNAILNAESEISIKGNYEKIKKRAEKEALKYANRLNE